MIIYKGYDGFEQFAEFIELSKKEKDQRRKLLEKSFMPFMVSKYYAEVIKRHNEPTRTHLLNIILPYPGKSHFVGRFDPYGNKRYRKEANSFIQHKYKRTLLLHMYDFCISNCQFCYKVNEIRHEDKGKVSLGNKIDIALNYINDHPEIDNILFSGGDPAAMSQKTLIECISRLINHKNIRIVRFATKVLAFDPIYFSNKRLLDFFKNVNQKENKQITIIAQINHPGEVTEEVISSIKLLQDSGVQLRGQPTVALGINSDSEVLSELLKKYIDNQVVPYYFTVFMPVRGVEQYGIKLHEAFEIMSNAKSNVNGLEKKGVFVASHDFGKLEICGFYPKITNPEKIILKWHQVAMDKYLPESLKSTVPCQPDDLLILKYNRNNIYCIDHLFEFNNLPHFDKSGHLVESLSIK